MNIHSILQQHGILAESCPSIATIQEVDVLKWRWMWPRNKDVWFVNNHLVFLTTIHKNNTSALTHLWEDWCGLLLLLLQTAQVCRSASFHQTTRLNPRDSPPPGLGMGWSTFSKIIISFVRPGGGRLARYFPAPCVTFFPGDVFLQFWD